MNANKELFDFRQIKLPTIFFIIYILLIPFESIMATQIVVMVSYATLTALVTSIFVLIYLFGRPKLLRVTKIAFSWVAFFLWAGISIYWSISKATSIYDYIFITKHLFFLLIISSYPFNYTEKRIIRHAVILSGILLAGTIFFSTFSLGGASTFVRATIANGYYQADPNQIASTLLLPISFLIVDFVERKKFSVLDLIASIILFGTLVYTGSRGAFVAFLLIICYLIIAYYKQKHKKKVILSLVFVLAGISLAISIMNPDLLTRFAKVDNLDRYSAKRTIIWREAIKLYPAKPLAGYGFGTFRVLTKSMVRDFKSAHNIAIQALLEEGAIGLLLFILAVIPTITVKTETAFDRAAKAGVIGVLVSGMFLYNFGHDYFWLSIIFAEIANRSRSSNPLENKKLEPQKQKIVTRPVLIDM